MFDAVYQKGGMPLLANPNGILTSTSGDGGGSISTAMHAPGIGADAAG